VPGNHKQGGPIRCDEAADWVPPGTSSLSLSSGRHCERCRCRCGCHRPPPEPPMASTPPRPGSSEWSGYLAGLSADLGSLAAAYGAVEEGRVA
jgi:hypothetical protein